MRKFFSSKVLKFIKALSIAFLFMSLIFASIKNVNNLILRIRFN